MERGLKVEIDGIGRKLTSRVAAERNTYSVYGHCLITNKDGRLCCGHPQAAKAWPGEWLGDREGLTF